jgi:apolipoprotein N-acyltransferase
MSSLILTVSVLLVGTVTYVLLQRLVTVARVIGACLPMVLLTIFIVNLENLGATIRRANPWPFTFFERHELKDANPSEDSEITFQSISKEDYAFLDQILAKQIQQEQQRKQTAVQPDLVVDPEGAKRSEAVGHKETVKRAQLVIHNQMFKRAELVRSREQ